MDTKGDISFIDRKAQIEERGNLPYYQPNGWIRFGLNVKRYHNLDKNNNWLKMNGNPD